MVNPSISGRVLCIDDDARMRRAVANSLVPLGIDVFEASGSTDALQLATEGTIDLVICDYVLEDTDGLELIAKLKEHQPDATYALMTGVSDINLVIGAINSRTITFFILKPWHAEELREIVRTALTPPRTPKSDVPPPVVMTAPVPKRKLAPFVVLGVAAGMLLSSAVALVLGHREARHDALFLAQRVADLALAAPEAAVAELAGSGITYVTVSKSDGELVAFGVDRESAQVPGTDRDAAMALREVGANDRLIVAESRNETSVAEAGVAAEAFTESVAELRYLLVAAAAAAALAAVGAVVIR